MHVFAKAYLLGKESNADEIKKKLAAANPGSLVQAVRTRSARNEAFIEMLAAQTFRAEASNALLARKPEMDLLLRVAGTTQISKAIRSHGVVEGEGFLAINAGRDRLSVPSGLRRAEIARRPLSATEFSKIERAALLDAGGT